MAQRAYAQVGGIQNNGPDMLAAFCTVNYMDFDGPISNQSKAIVVTVSADTSARKLVDAIFAAVVVEQPVGFALQERDVIVSGLT